MSMASTMQVPKIQVQQLDLPTIITNMGSGQFQVPRFQRDFVWPLTKTRALLDSMYKEFPIGTFFLWRAPIEAPLLTRPLTELGIPKPQEGTSVTYILDGQQRLTSLFCTINATKIKARDYGRICIDLEIATKYDLTQDEDFKEDIFVYRTGDNQRYVSVHELVSAKSLMIFSAIPEHLKMAYNKAFNLFKTYPFSVVWIQGQTLPSAIEIFQRINQAGQPLSRYDLICANVWRKDFDFRKQVSDVNETYKQKNFGKIEETIFTQTFAMILHDQCTTIAELSLTTDELIQVWDKAIASIDLAINFALSNLGVKRFEFLPYRGILVVLAYYFYRSPKSAITARERHVLWSWFWRVTLSERYSSTSPIRMAEDAKKLLSAQSGQAVSFSYPSSATKDSVLRTKMTSTSSALRNAILCMLALRQPKNIKDGSPVNLYDNFFTDIKLAERHHIFPVGYLKAKGIASSLVRMLPNFCFIPSDLNKEIGSNAPKDYLTKYQKSNPGFSEAADSNLIPIDKDSPIWNNDFNTFMEARAQLLADSLNQLADTTSITLAQISSPFPLSSQVDILEIKVRDFIHHRLDAVIGQKYWKSAIPGDVISYVEDKIKDHLSHHPYEDPTQYTNPRKKLDFCDVAHYEKIILKNWIQFNEIFVRKEDFQTHIIAFRALRNCVQHNRKPTDIEEKNGEAALLWLGRIIDQYHLDISELDRENGEEEEPIEALN